jgi:hypothetical protein
MAEIHGIVYSRGMLESLADRESCEVYTLYGPEIPRKVLEAIEGNRLLELSGVYGDERLGDPIEYDQLVLETDKGETTIEVYNRGLMLFVADSDEVRRIHRVLCVILDSLGV